MSADLLCRCGHLQSAHGIDDDDSREKNTICGVAGCPCELFRSFEAVAEEVLAPVYELHGKPDPIVIKMPEDLLEAAKAGQISGLVALSFEPGTQRRWHAGAWTRADALWAFEHMKHRLLFGEQ